MTSSAPTLSISVAVPIPPRAATATAVPSVKPRGRIFLTRMAAVPFFLLLLVADDAWADGHLAESLVMASGALAVVIAILGRLWCTLYIGGRKTSKLITHGPYSLCRNPLYFFSALGVCGLAATTGMLTIVALVAVAFAIYYPRVIAREERDLSRVHGEDFAAYCKGTPRFWPSPRVFNEPETGEFRPVFLYKACRDATGFAAVWVAIFAIHVGHDTGLIPILVHLR